MHTLPTAGDGLSSQPFRALAPNRRTHSEAIFDLVALQWRDDLREHCRNGRINYSHYDWQTSRVGMVGEELVTHYGVYDTAVRIGRSQVRAAGVNLVVTHPDYRKRGLMPKTIWSSIEAMRANGYDLSIVANAVESYYERFGYIVAWPETHYFISVDDLPTEHPKLRLRKFNTRHTPILADLYNRENSTLTGTAVRPTFLRTKEPGDLSGYLMLDEYSRTVGYVIYDTVSQGSALWHYDSAGDPEERLRVLAHIARRMEADEVRFNRLPHNSELARQLRLLNCYSEIKYARSGGWMIQIINLRTLFEKLTEELTSRLAHSHMAGWSGHLRIATKHESIVLAVQNGSILVADAQNAPPDPDIEHTIEGGEEIALLVIGTEAPAETTAAARTHLQGDAQQLIEALFPKQYPQMGNADI